VIFVVLGAVGSIGGAALLVAAFRRGQAGDRDGERRLFGGAVAGLGAGMVLFAVALLTAPH
jgi:hypothetical protein